MRGAPGATSRMTSPPAPLTEPVLEAAPAIAALTARHSSRARLAACATAVLVGRDRLDTFEATTFGADHSTPTPHRPSLLGGRPRDDYVLDEVVDALQNFGWQAVVAGGHSTPAASRRP